MVEQKIFRGVHTIDGDSDPVRPYQRWWCAIHEKNGQLDWDITSVRLHRLQIQMDGGLVSGEKLRKELSGEIVLNVNVLNYLLQHQDLLLDCWKFCPDGKPRQIFFWGTLFNCPHVGPCVPYLHWEDEKWKTDYAWIGRSWGSNDFSIILVNPKISHKARA